MEAEELREARQLLQAKGAESTARAEEARRRAEEAGAAAASGGGGGGGGGGSGDASANAMVAAAGKLAAEAEVLSAQVRDATAAQEAAAVRERELQDALAEAEGAGATATTVEEAAVKVAKDPPAAGGSTESDADALRAWRAECPELRKLWDESEPVTEWEGVTFGEAGGADAGRVVGIDFENKGLTGDVPAALGGLTALTSLDLHENQLTSVPEELGELTALETLILSKNQLTSVPAALGVSPRWSGWASTRTS